MPFKIVNSETLETKSEWTNDLDNKMQEGFKQLKKELTSNPVSMKTPEAGNDYYYRHPVDENGIKLYPKGGYKKYTDNQWENDLYNAFAVDLQILAEKIEKEGKI